VAGHLLRFATQNQFLRLPCEQLDGATIYVITGFKIGHLADFRSPCSPKCPALSRFREPQATALRLFFRQESLTHTKKRYQRRRALPAVGWSFEPPNAARLLPWPDGPDGIVSARVSGVTHRPVCSCSAPTLLAFTSRTAELGWGLDLRSFSCAPWSAKPLPPHYEVFLVRLCAPFFWPSSTRRLSILTCPCLAVRPCDRRRPVGGDCFPHLAVMYLKDPKRPVFGVRPERTQTGLCKRNRPLQMLINTLL